MTHDSKVVVTLVAGDGARISADFLQNIATRLNATGSEWLASGIAADIFCHAQPTHLLRAEVQKSVANQPIDFIVQLAETRRKNLLLADMESTIIEQEMLDELAEKIGQRPKVTEITRRAMNGELDFAAALRARVALLKGQPESILNEVAESISFMPGAQALLATIKKHGAQAWLISGGFTRFAEPVARQLGFDQSFANSLIIHDGILTGEVADPILDKNSKKALLEKACRDQGILLDHTVAVGDGANDIPMLSCCRDGGGLGVAYQAKPNVRAAIADQINYGDLTVLLYAQGYKLTEFLN
jgi:phosphoserine phosphatase